MPNFNHSNIEPKKQREIYVNIVLISSVYVEDCQDCTIFVAARQVRGCCALTPIDLSLLRLMYPQ